MLAWWLTTVLAWGGGTPDLPQVLQALASYRDMRIAEGAPTLTDGQLREVAQGGVVTGLVSVEGEAARKSYGAAILDRPIRRVWGAISDESLHPEYTSLSYAELVNGAPCESGRHVLQFLPVGVPMVKDRWWVTIRHHNDAMRKASGGRVRELVYRNAPDGSDVTSEAGRAKLTEGVMVGFTRGAWLLTAIGEEQTLVEYYSWVDPGGNLSPTLMSWFAGKTIRTTLESMEKLAGDERLRCVD